MQPVNDVRQAVIIAAQAFNEQAEAVEVAEALRLVENAEAVEAAALVARQEAAEAAAVAEAAERALALEAVRQVEIAQYVAREEKALEAARVPAMPDLSKMKAKDKGELILDSMDVETVKVEKKRLTYTVRSPLMKGHVTVSGKGRRPQPKDMTVEFSGRIKKEIKKADLSSKKIKKLKEYIVENTLDKAKRMARS